MNIPVRKQFISEEMATDDELEAAMQVGQNNLDTEITNRTQADILFQQSLDQEALTRSNADSTLTNNLATEVTNRTNADNIISDNLNTEITNRTNADNGLQSQITNIVNNFASNVRSTTLTGLNLSINSAITVSDTVLSGLGKLQSQITDLLNTFQNKVRSTVLTGISFSVQTAIVATDTVLESLGKIQGQINLFSTKVNPETSATNSSNTQGNSTSFARADHVHKIELYTNHVKAVNEVQTNSSTDVLLSGMTITPPAGTYNVTAYTKGMHSSGGATWTPSLYAGGVIVANTQDSVTRNSGLLVGGGSHVWSAIAEVTVNGSQAIEIRWKTSNGTASIYGRYLKLDRKS